MNYQPGTHREHLQLIVQATWTNVFAGKARLSLEDRVMRYVQTQRWFGRKAREVKGATFVERVPVSFNSADACITQIQIEYTEEDSETYMLPLSFAAGERTAQIRQASPSAI